MSGCLLFTLCSKQKNRKSRCKVWIYANRSETEQIDKFKLIKKTTSNNKQRRNEHVQRTVRLVAQTCYANNIYSVD